MVECQSCRGQYEPIQPDGSQYFHRCPPLSSVELQAAVDAGRVQLPKGETVEDALQTRVYERANARDENIISTHATHAGTVKAPGAGVLEVVDADEPVQVVVDMGGVALPAPPIAPVVPGPVVP